MRKQEGQEASLCWGEAKASGQSGDPPAVQEEEQAEGGLAHHHSPVQTGPAASKNESPALLVDSGQWPRRVERRTEAAST